MATMSVQQAELGQLPFSHIAVIGFGLVGASFAAALREVHPNVDILAVDVDERTLEEALTRGWANAAVLPDDPAFRRYIEEDCDLVLIATPVADVEEYLQKLADWNYSGLVSDAVSTKARIVEAAARILPHPENYVPGHPMAGSEQNGIDGARADLFQGAHWILCPDADTSADRFAQLHELVTSIGARVVVLPREQHDAAVAVVSHVPHIVASALVQLACRHADEQQALMRLAAGGFKDTTRIAAGAPELWCGIAFDNKEALLGGLDEICEIIGLFTEALETDDADRLTELLADSSAARRALPTAWVPSTERLLEVRIPMENHPGVVADVTTITSSVGCNIQSIEIDHVTEDSAVLSLVLTDEGDIGKLSAQLIDAGYAVSFSPLTAKEHTHVE